MSKPIINALTVDVEDYFHVSAFNQSVKRDDWGTFESRVERNTNQLLTLFEEFDIKATFFVLGWVAERNPDLVKRIYAQGHEVASHGYSHQLVYNQPIDVFKDETLRSKRILEDIIQAPVLGYRAASYSITNKSEWALDILAEAGFSYDSSIFPVHHDRYGIPGSPKFPYVRKTPAGHSLVEFPLSSVKLLGYQLPIAGGGYFRLYPYFFTRFGLGLVNKTDNPFVFYLHPWEIDPEQPKIKASLLSRFRHYNNLNKCEQRLRHLLRDFNFSTMANVLSHLALLETTDQKQAVNLN